MQERFDEEVEKLTEDAAKYAAWKEIYVTDEKGEFVEKDGSLFLTLKGRKIMREIQAREFNGYSEMPIDDVITCMENVEIIDHINKIDSGNIRKKLLNSIRKKEGIQEEEYVSDEEINARLNR